MPAVNEESATTVIEALAETPQSIIEKAKKQWADLGVREPVGEQSRRLNSIVDDIQKSIPAAIPEAKLIPPKPALLIYDDTQINFRTMSYEKGENVIMFSSGALRSWSDAELKGALAHEMAGHNVVQMNSDMEGAYSPPNLLHVIEDMKAQGINYKTDALNAPDLSMQKKYLKEMQADYNAVRVTRDPAALMSALNKGAESRQNALDKIVKETIDQLSKDGKLPVNEDRATLEQSLRETLQQMQTSDPHPDNEIRIESMYMHEAQLQNAPSDPAPLVTQPGLAPSLR